MRELASLKEAYPRLRGVNAQVVGISADTLASHERFAATLGGLPFPLVSDPELQAVAAYGVQNEKGTGARRSVFVVDRLGIITHTNDRFELSKPEHFEALLAAVGLE